MTAERMQEECRIYADKVDSATLPELLVREWNYFLTEAMHRFIKTRYGLTNIYQQGAESIQKRIDDLQAIIVTEDLNDTNLVIDNTYSQYPSQAILLEQLSQNYMFFMKCICKVSHRNCDREDDLKIISHDKWGRVMNDPYNRPEKWATVGLFESNKLIILYGRQSTLESVKFTYIRIPQDIEYVPNGVSTDCELAEHTHKEIVQMAVSLAIESVLSPRVQTTINNLPNIE